MISPLARIVTRPLAALAAALLLFPAGAEAALRHRTPPADVSDKPMSLETPEATFPFGMEWSLAELNGKPAQGDTPSFTLDDKMRATGFSGCNTYSMTLYPVRGQKLAAGAIAMTRKQCDKDAMLFERTFLVTLHGLPVWSIEGSDLVVKAGPTTLRFRRGL